ncbi:hypothetical protein Tdes44962_MAKER02781 [Teratosphaeria destructans]|uniref:Uncharacterized protein n=1 Tax=Teratosphaeria destructans TaxID=418781 RepID=A0A9W7SS01_9PEZI|nr:hypothetical protein Tdes44962_MAKER02781 [Teratosphaeria destructans]
MAKSSSSAASRSLASARRKRAPTRSKPLSFKVGNGIVKTIPGGSKQPRYKGPGGTIKTAGSRTIPSKLPHHHA